MLPSLTHLRQDAGLGTPNWQQKQLIFSKVVSPTAQIASGYEPGPTAAKAHRSDARAVGASGGAGAGKSLWSGMEALTWLPFSLLVWVMGMGYRNARPEFVYLAEGAQSSGLALPADVRIPDDPDKACSLFSVPHPSPAGPVRCEVRTLTLRDYERQAATRRPDLIVLCEPGLIEGLAQMEPTIWGRLAERRGRLIAAGTSEESSEDWFQIMNEWKQADNDMGGEIYTLPTWENTKIYPLGIRDPVFVSYRKRFGEELFMMRYGGVPAPPKGLVLKGYWGEHLVFEDLEFDPGLPTEVFIDPNSLDPAKYSVGFVQWDEMTGDINIVDEIARSGLTHPEMVALFRQHPLAKFVMGGVIDPHAAGHRTGAGIPPDEYWREVVPDLRFNNGKQIPVVRTVGAIKEMMAQRAGGSRPRLRVSSRCERMIYEGPRWKLSGQGKPRTDFCDMLKAFGYWSVDKLHNERITATFDRDNIIQASDYDFTGRVGIGRTPTEKAYWREHDKIYGGVS